MNITSQRYIAAIAETRSLTKAASSLGITQSALSKWLDRIEWELGTKLAVRAKNEILLTTAGRIYLEGSREMLSVRNKAYQAIARDLGNPIPALTITGTPNGGMALFSELFQPFLTRFPRTELRFQEAYNKESMALVLSGNADLGLCSFTDFSHKGLHLAVPKTNELVLLIPKGYELYYDSSKMKPSSPLPVISLSDIKDIPFILPSPEISFHDVVEELFSAAGLKPSVLFRSSNVKAIYNMIRNGNGAGFLNRGAFRPGDPVAPYSLSPGIIYYSGVAYRAGEALTPQQSFAIEWIGHKTLGDG